MKELNSKKIIILGLILGLLFSAITYQNFKHNIEEVIEEQEIKSNSLIDHSLDMILENINNMVANTIKISISNVNFQEDNKKNTILIEQMLPTIQKNIESSFEVSSVSLIFTNTKIYKKENEIEASFLLENNQTFYSLYYPLIINSDYLGTIKINLFNSEILNRIKINTDAEVGLFMHKRIMHFDTINKETYKDYIVTNSTNKKLTTQMINDKKFSLEDSEEVFRIDDQLIELDIIELSNIDNLLVVFKDVTETYESIEKTVHDFIMYFIIVLFIFLFVSYFIYYNSNKTIEEQYNKLLKKKEESEKLLKVKSEFLANMSHEIRTPLNAMNGFIDLIEEETQDKKILKYIDTIQSSSKSLLHIIEDILDLSKIESGKMAINKIDFDTKAEFETIAYLFNTKISSKNLSFHLNIDSSLPTFLNSDSLRIKQVISNLIDNAIKFTDRGKKITVDISYSDNNLYVCVEDEGIGISKERQKKIFKPFTQADNSTTRKYGGSGLGLTISSKIIELLGGKLQLDSELYNGSKFYFSIPVSIGDKVIHEKTTENVFNFENKKILLVEDNKSNQLFMKIILQKLKLDFDIANDGMEAINKFKSNKYDLVLMDENMPHMSGIEATQEILKIELEKEISHTPIIALTANALEGDKEKFLSAGMDDYLSKPIAKSKLSKVLSTYFR